MIAWLRRLCSQFMEEPEIYFSSDEEDNENPNLGFEETGASTAPSPAKIDAAGGGVSSSMHSESPEFRASASGPTASGPTASDGVPSSTLEQPFSDHSVQQEGPSRIFGVIYTDGTYVGGGMMVDGCPDTLVNFGSDGILVPAAGGGVSSK